MIKIDSVLAGGFLPLILVLGIFVANPCSGEESDPLNMFTAEIIKVSLDDEEITSAVDIELFLDEGVASHLIDIDTKEGIVTLSGSVDNILAKERAEEIAETVRGVRSVVNLTEVKPLPRKDTELRMDIERALLLDPAADSYEVEVEVNDGKVTLTGAVDSWAEKELVAYVAKGVKGVKEVKNDIRVYYKTSRTDSEIEAEVERQLEIDPLIDEGMIFVKVEDKKVILSGTVGSAIEKNRVYGASWVAGVDDVDDSKVDVRFMARDERQRYKTAVKSDVEIEEAVKDAFLYDPRVFAFEIEVEAENGMVTLEGEVDNLKAKKAAGQDALNTIGVWRVENEIDVRPVFSLTDEEIELNVEQALLWNPVVERFELTVFVRNKKVYLYGRVDSNYEKMEAEDVASRVNGVVSVANKIQVDDVWNWKGDKEIKQDILQQFSWNIFVYDDDIEVTVENGVATLEGEVDSIMELDSAIKDAFDGGARRVTNRLTIAERPDYYPDLHIRDYWWPYWPYWPPA